MSGSKVVLVVGSINMDLVVRADRLPAPGETVMGEDLCQFAGGKGANQAVAAARMGATVRMIGSVGEDSFGVTLVESLKADGIETRYISCSGARASGVALITVDSRGQNSIVVSPGANALVFAKYVEACESAFDGAGVLLLQLETPIEGCIAAAKIAKKRNIRVVLNPAPARTLPAELLNLVDDIIPNQSELAQLTGTSEIEAGIREMQKLVNGRVIVTLGGDGAVLAEGSDRKRFSPHRVNVVDTTAAGDSFVGAFAAALSEGKNAVAACEYGMAAGALCVTVKGAQASLPKLSAVEKLLRG